MSLKKKLIIAFISVILLHTLLLVLILTNRYKTGLVDWASSAVLSVVRQNNGTVNAILTECENASVYMIVNRTMHDFFSNVDDYSGYRLTEATKSVNQQIAGYSNVQNVYSVQLYTSRRIFGETAQNPVIGRFEDTGFLEIAREAKGSVVWISGYDYFERFGIDYLPENHEEPYKNLITMVRQMNFSHMSQTEYKTLPPDAERPILFVNIREERLRETFSESIAGLNNTYLLINENGMVISSNQPDIKPANPAPPEFAAFKGKDGVTSAVFGGVDYVFCYSPVASVGWTAIAAVPYSELVQQITREILLSAVITASPLFIAAIALAVAISVNMSRPLEQMVQSVKKIGEGDFSVCITIPEGSEYKHLAEAFNRMLAELENLIAENYKAAMREREAHINLLTMQINPHFLSNTLNSINMLAIKNGDYEASNLIVSLSEMLYYTFKNNSEKVPLNDEIAWVKSYMDIMFIRYTGVFTMSISVPPGLEQYILPKMILQPFLENSITHGFQKIMTGGELSLEIIEKPDKLEFTIKDNGCGFDIEAYRAMPSGAHTGIENVERRLKLLYGTGCEVEIKSGDKTGTQIQFWVKKEL